jgi:tetratricopeptide (TPR) repeat protein
MTDDDGSRSPSPDDSGAPILLIPQPKPRTGPVLQLLDDSPSVASMDDLAAMVEGPMDSGPLSEDNEPLTLSRPNVARPAAPPAPARRPLIIDPPRARSAPPARPPQPASPPRPVAAPAPAPRPQRAPTPSKPPRPARASVKPGPTPVVRAAPETPLLDVLKARVTSLEAAGDHLALGRALAELAVIHDLADDAPRAVASARAALEKDATLAAMHALLRRREHAPGAAAALLAHVDEEIGQASSAPVRTALLAERARLLGALDRDADAVSAWSQVLAHDPRHAAALRGKEAALTRLAGADAATWEAVAAHLGVMAEAYADDPRAAAWFHVERAAVLESRLGKVDAARHALARGLALDPRVGPVRHAMVRHVARRRDAAALVDLLDEEGRIEGDPARAARLELEAATIAEQAVRDTPRAVTLLDRAAARAPTTPGVDLRVLGDLTRLLESAGRSREAVRWRRARLALLQNAAERGAELRALARGAEQSGNLDAAIADLEASIAEQFDPGAVSHLDRLLADAGRHEERVRLRVSVAARTAEPTRRVAQLMCAADIAERALGRPDEAVLHLRAAWTTKPGHPEVVEALTRLLSRPTTDPEARSRLELYAHAAEVAEDRPGRIAYLERVALLAEEMLGDFRRAADACEAILVIEPARVGALLGLARNASRVGDDLAVHRALMAQAKMSRSETEALALQTRAAAVLAKVDAPRALSLATEVLAADATHEAARALVTRLHEDAGRWDLVARALEDHAAHAPPADRLPLLLYLAEVEEVRLGTPRDALATLARARRGSPDDGRVLVAMARVLAGIDDPGALREALEALATSATREEDRARYLVQAAELSEHALDDDAAARRAYEDALRATPGDAMIADRLERVRARSADGSPTDVLDRALDLVTRGGDDDQAVALLEPALAAGAEPVPTCRLLERLHRRAKAWASLASVLARQAEAFDAPGARLGALWSLAEVEEWRLEVRPGRTTYARILAIDPDDPAALAATVRTQLKAALAGSEPARRAVTETLRRQARLEADGGRVVADLMLAHVLASPGAEVGEAAATEALDRCRDALSTWPASVVAASEVRRLAQRLGRTATAVHACTALGELTVPPQAAALHFIEAADLVSRAEDTAGLGDGPRREIQAASLLGRALAADPDSVAAASALVALSRTSDQADALLGALRAALERSKAPEVVILLGTEVARVARDDLHDLGVATRAMQRVRDVAPRHAPSLLTLAELCAAAGALPEAASTFEAAVEHSTEREPRLTALFELARLYDKALARPGDHERVLRAALALDPDNPRALRELVDLLHARAGGSGSGAQDRGAGAREEIARLLEKLGRAS